jgi:hypothetical protein
MNLLLFSLLSLKQQFFSFANRNNYTPESGGQVAETLLLFRHHPCVQN